MYVYDFTDPAIEKMVATSHGPKEDFTSKVDGTSESRGIDCFRCHQGWPCPPVVQLREFQKQKLEKNKERFGEEFKEAQGRPPIIMLPRSGINTVVPIENVWNVGSWITCA